MAVTSPSCSTKPWPRWRFERTASTSTPRSAAAGTAARFSRARPIRPSRRPRPRSRGGSGGAARSTIRASRSAARGSPSFPECSRHSDVAHVDGVLLDLGISSPQIDDPARGFSFRADGPLDMRMDPTRGESAAAFLARADARELTEVIRDYGEERFAQSIARAIVAARAVAPVVRTRQLAAIVAQAVGARARGDWGQDPATRTFQALRIFVNRELAELALTLPRLPLLLAPGGRLAVISFHSLEDRIVKRFFAFAVAAVRRRSRGSRGCRSPHGRAAGRAARAGRPRDPRRPTRGRRQPARAQRDAARGRAHRASGAAGLRRAVAGAEA